MKAQILKILTEVQEGTKNPIIAQKELLDLFDVSNRVFAESCKVVVDGYEGDGMEGMRNRDKVFYEYCKRALEHCR